MHPSIYMNSFNSVTINQNNFANMNYAYCRYANAAEFSKAISNQNPKLDRAQKIASEVRSRKPEMQVKRITNSNSAAVAAAG